MELNTQYIRVRGSLELEVPLKMGDEVKVVVEVVDIQDSNNHDGTLDRTYKAKLIDILDIL